MGTDIESLVLKIKVECAYSDGHESTVVETVAIQPVNDREELWEQLQDFTGDGHGIGRDLGYCHTITILESNGDPDLVDLTNEWCGA